MDREGRVAVETMKAVRIHEFGGADKLVYEDAPVPEPAAGQVLVRVRAAGVNPVDYKIASGAYGKESLTLPYIPGNDFSGIVEALGPGVTAFKEGDDIYGNCRTGAYAQFVAAPANTSAAGPRKLSHTEAAAVPTAGMTAWQALFDRGRLEEGQMVLIHGGSGGVGTFAVQLAHWKGAIVLATGAAENLEYLRSIGADMAIDYKTTRFESAAKDVDLVLDLVGGETQARSLAVVRQGGYLVSTVQQPSQEEADRRGIHALVMRMQPSRENMDQLAELLDAGEIRAIVTKTFPLAQASDAWAQIMSGHTRGKIALEVP